MTANTHGMEACCQEFPTLAATWGRALAHLEKEATPSWGYQGDEVTCCFAFLGTGNFLVLTNTTPVELSAPIAFGVHATSVAPIYDSDHHRVTWNDTPDLGQEVLIHYTSTIATADTTAIANAASLFEIDGEISTYTAIVIVNPTLFHLPLVFRGK